MSVVEVTLPVEVPGEDLANPPHPPVPALRALGAAEFAGPLKHDGWLGALPEWDDLTAAEHDEHRAFCIDLCAMCEEHRGFGDCVSCGAWGEATDRGLSMCCGSHVSMRGDAA